MALDAQFRRGMLWSVGLYAAAFATLSFSGMKRSTLTVWLAALMLLAAALVLHLTLRRVRDNELLRPGRRLLIPIGIVAVGVALCLYWFLGNPTDGWGLAGLCATFMGLGHVLAEARSWRWGAPWRGMVWSGACAVLFVVGLFMALGTSAGWLAMSGVALLASPIGLSLLSEDLLRGRSIPLTRFVPLGLVVAAGGVVGLRLAGIPWFFVPIAAVLAFVLVGTIASNSQADVLLVATLVALLWTATPHAVDLDDAVKTAKGQPTLVSLGDSYMSGEGAMEFYEGTNDAKVNECRRAPTAYAHLIVEPGRAKAMQRLAFLACSGARAYHIHETPQWRGEPADGSPDAGEDQLDQLDGLLTDSDIDISLVVVSIGGNDAGFAEVGIACLAPGSCVERGQAWLDRLQEVAPQIDRAYQEIRTVVGTEVPVLVVPYPEPIKESRCGYSLMTGDEHRFLYGFVQQLNGIVHQAAKDAGFYYLKGMTTAFTDSRLRICDGDADKMGVNFIAIKSVNGLIDQAVNPVNWFHNSLHPNERGHATMADTLEAWIEQNPDPKPKADPDSEAGPFQVAALADIMGPMEDISFCGSEDDEPAYCDRDGTAWVVTQLGVLIRDVTVPLLLLTAGCWFIWLAVLQRTRPWGRRFGDRLTDWLF